MAYSNLVQEIDSIVKGTVAIVLIVVLTIIANTLLTKKL